MNKTILMWICVLVIPLVFAGQQTDSGAPHTLDYGNVAAGVEYSEDVNIDGGATVLQQQFDKDTNITVAHTTATLNPDDMYEFDFGLLFNGNYFLTIVAKDKSYAQNPSEYFSSFILDKQTVGINLIEPHLGVAPQRDFDVILETEYDAVCRWGYFGGVIQDNAQLTYLYGGFESFAETLPSTTHTQENFLDAFDTEYGVLTEELQHVNLMVICELDRSGTPLYEYKIFDVYYDTSKPIIISVANDPEVVKEITNPITELQIETDDTTVCYLTETTTKCMITDQLGFCKYQDTAFAGEDFDNRSSFATQHTENILFDGIPGTTQATFRMRCKNIAGVYSDNKSYTIVLDPTEAPIIRMLSPLNYTKNNPVNLTIKADKILDCQYDIDSGTKKDFDDHPSQFEMHASLSGLTDGNHTINLFCNSISIPGKTYERIFPFIIDRTNPTLQITVLEKSCGLNGISATLNGTDAMGIDHYEYSIYKMNGSLEEPIIVNKTTTESDITETFNLEEGKFYKIKAKAYDLALNPSALITSRLIEATLGNLSVCDKLPPRCAYSISQGGRFFTLYCRDEYGCKDKYYFMQTPYGNTEETVTFQPYNHQRDFLVRQVIIGDKTPWGKEWYSKKSEKITENKTVYYKAFDENNKYCFGKVDIEVTEINVSTTIAPVVVIQEPFKDSVYNELNIPIRIQAFDDNEIQSIWYSIETTTATNITNLPIDQVYTDAHTIELSDMTEYKITASAQDEFGNIGKDEAIFMLNTSAKKTDLTNTKLNLTINSPEAEATYVNPQVALEMYSPEPYAAIVYRLNTGGFKEYTQPTTITGKNGTNDLLGVLVPIQGSNKELGIKFYINESYQGDLCLNTNLDAGNFETDIDCGGKNCKKCENNMVCIVPTDCKSAYCDAGVCKDAPCDDAIQNGLESDVDCGGGICTGCELTKSCYEDADCLSNVCIGGICEAERPGVDPPVPPETEEPKGVGLAGWILIILGIVMIIGGGGYVGYEHYYEHIPFLKNQQNNSKESHEEQAKKEGNNQATTLAQTRTVARPGQMVPQTKKPVPQQQSKPTALKRTEAPATQKIRSNLKRYKRNSLFDEFEDESEKKTPSAPPPKKQTPTQKKLSEKKKESFGDLDAFLEEEHEHAPKDLDELNKDD